MEAPSPPAPQTTPEPASAAASTCTAPQVTEEEAHAAAPVGTAEAEQGADLERGSSMDAATAARLAHELGEQVRACRSRAYH